MSEQKIDKILKALTSLDTKVGGIDTKVSNLDTKVSNLESKVTNITGIVIHLKDKVDNELATKDKVDEIHNNLLSHIDGFIKLHETLDQELVSLRHKYDRLEERIKMVEIKIGM